MAAMMTRLTAALRSGPIKRRLYGTAAQLQYEYDDSEYESSSEMEDSLGSVSSRGVQWVVMGDHRQVFANKLSKLLNVPSISMGTLVRQELNPRSDIYKKLSAAVKPPVYAAVGGRLRFTGGA
ncbi:probable adenylate kinase 7, mitochondrial [Tanacetum coccineum]